MLSILSHHIQKKNNYQQFTAENCRQTLFLSQGQTSWSVDRRFSNAMIGKVQPCNKDNITSAMKLDVQMWLDLLTKFNGVVYCRNSKESSEETSYLFSQIARGQRRKDAVHIFKHSRPISSGHLHRQTNQSFMTSHFYTPGNKVWAVYRNHPVRMSVQNLRPVHIFLAEKQWKFLLPLTWGCAMTIT